MIEEQADYHVGHRNSCKYQFLTVLLFLYFHGNNAVTVWRKTDGGNDIILSREANQ